VPGPDEDSPEKVVDEHHIRALFGQSDPRDRRNLLWNADQVKADVGKIILKVISDQIKIIFSKNDFKSDQDHIFLKNDLDLKSRSKIIFCSQSPLFESKHFK
jgi:hypothetical protein